MTRTFLLGLTAAAALAMPAAAQDLDAAVKARAGQMSVISYNLGLLGAMAKGEMTYDADLATAAAGNVAAAAGLHVATMWPEGSDNVAHPTSRANPAVWSDAAGFQIKFDELVKAASAAETTVGNGAEALGPALGAMGGTCKGCHETYRGPRR